MDTWSSPAFFHQYTVNILILINIFHNVFLMIPYHFVLEVAIIYLINHLFWSLRLFLHSVILISFLLRANYFLQLILWVFKVNHLQIPIIWFLLSNSVTYFSCYITLIKTSRIMLNNSDNNWHSGPIIIRLIYIYPAKLISL